MLCYVMLCYVITDKLQTDPQNIAILAHLFPENSDFSNTHHITFL